MRKDRRGTGQSYVYSKPWTYLTMAADVEQDEEKAKVREKYVSEIIRQVRL